MPKATFLFPVLAMLAQPVLALTLDLPAKVLEQLIIGTYGNFDPLQSAAAKGATARNDYLARWRAVGVTATRHSTARCR